MTTQKHLKERVRARMARTGERYAVARAHVVEAGRDTDALGSAGVEVGGIRHFPGVHPETTVARILATHAGVRDAGGEPPTEASMLAIGGGLGAGVFAFNYEREAFSSLFLAGRHRWEDSAGWMDGALRRAGLEPAARETGSVRQAERDLRDALGAGGPVAAWVDWVELGHRGRPTEGSGGAYHVLVVYALDGESAIVGDLARDPLVVPLDVLGRARARIAKHRNRLVTVAPAGRGSTDLAVAARRGLAAGSEALATTSRRNFSLDAITDLADRMVAPRGATSWASVFPRGRRLWTGLTSLYRFVETYATGGGLLRPMAAEALAELPGLDEGAARYAELGERWADLASTALSPAVPQLAEARAALDVAEGRLAPEGPAAAVARQRAWDRLDELGAAAEAAFPLSEPETADLLADLSRRLRAIHEGEVAALAVVRRATA